MDSCFLPMQNPFISFSIAWNWTSHWHCWLFWAAACPALQNLNINCQVTAWKFRCPSSPCSQAVFHRQGPYWETNSSADRVVVYFQSDIWHCSATRSCDSQGGIKTPDEYFGSRPRCLIFFICSDHVWNQCYWSVITRVSQLAIFPEIISWLRALRLTFRSWEMMDQANAIVYIVCIMLGVWIWKI